MKTFRFANRKCSSQYIRGAKSIISLAILIMLSVSVPSILNAGQKEGLSAGPKAESQVPSKKTKPKIHQAEKVELRKPIDLIVVKWSPKTAEITPGKSFKGTASWRNIGAGSTGKGYYVEMKISNDSIITKDDSTFSATREYRDELPSGHKNSAVFKVTMPFNLLCGSYYYMGPFVDSMDDIQETNENNNYNSMRFFVNCNK